MAIIISVRINHSVRPSFSKRVFHFIKYRAIQMLYPLIHSGLPTVLLDLFSFNLSKECRVYDSHCRRARRILHSEHKLLSMHDGSLWILYQCELLRFQKNVMTYWRAVRIRSFDSASLRLLVHFPAYFGWNYARYNRDSDSSLGLNMYLIWDIKVLATYSYIFSLEDW